MNTMRLRALPEERSASIFTKADDTAGERVKERVPPPLPKRIVIY
jgi:hypothetical protein